MDERNFDLLADAAMNRIEQALEASDGDIDFEAKAGGIIEIELDDGSKIIVNKHRAAREIWIAARSGGYHFKYEADHWVGTRDGADLMGTLSRCLGEQSGGQITLA